MRSELALRRCGLGGMMQVHKEIGFLSKMKKELISAKEYITFQRLITSGYLLYDFIEDMEININAESIISSKNLRNVVMHYYDYCINNQKSNFQCGVRNAEKIFNKKEQKDIIEKYINCKNTITLDEFCDIIHLLLIYFHSVNENKNLKFIFSKFIIEFYIDYSIINKLNHNLFELIIRKIYKNIFKKDADPKINVYNLNLHSYPNGYIIKDLLFVLKEYISFYEISDCLYYARNIHDYYYFRKIAEMQLKTWNCNLNVIDDISIIGTWSKINENYDIEERKKLIVDIIINFEEYIISKLNIKEIKSANNKKRKGMLGDALKILHPKFDKIKEKLRKKAKLNKTDLINYIIVNYYTSIKNDKSICIDCVNGILMHEYRNEKSHGQTPNRNTDDLLRIIIKAICYMY
jgi:hypothetical protein